MSWANLPCTCRAGIPFTPFVNVQQMHSHVGYEYPCSRIPKPRKVLLVEPLHWQGGLISCFSAACDASTSHYDSARFSCRRTHEHAALLSCSPPSLRDASRAVQQLPAHYVNMLGNEAPTAHTLQSMIQCDASSLTVAT